MAERRTARRAFRYVPAELLAGEPHVVVDGAPRAGTVCTLSHWPGTPTPEMLWHDVSAGIVVQALARPELLPHGVEVASIDHYDADGVIALALLCVDGLAADHGPFLVEAARVGDFGVVADRKAALVAFGLESLGDTGRAAEVLGLEPPGDDANRTAWAATVALDMVALLVEDPEHHRALWVDEAAAFDVSRRAISGGWATIEDRPDHDLAVVRVDTSHPDAPGAAWAGALLHPAAVHSVTPHLRVATVAGGSVVVRYRYETWVRLHSHRPRARVDLAGLAAELTRAEGATGRWVFDGAGAITGALHLAPGCVSTLDPDDVVDLLCARLGALDTGPAAWDPYAVSTGAG